MRRQVRYAGITLLCLGCGQDDAHPAAEVPTDASVAASESSYSTSGACAWPSPMASCTPRANYLVCTAPDDGMEQADGAIVDAHGQLVTDSCKNQCTGKQYALTCTGSDPASPAFTESLGCTVIPLPTPDGVSFWCCPCVE
jgi:hypothetical protein